jgi:hypothetical protein
MRMWILSMTLLLGACSASAALVVPVIVVGDGEVGVLLVHEVLPASGGAPTSGAPTSGAAMCRRATEVEHWAELCELFGGALAPRGELNPGFDGQQFVAVSLPPGTGLTGIVVSSEEGVDVITLDVEAGDVPGAVCLLQLSRRPCQLAIIVRDQQLGQEHTVAVFSGL